MTALHPLTLCSSTLDSEPSLRWPASHGGCGLSERRFLPLRFRACLFSRQPTARAWSPPSPKPPRAACSELSSRADTRSWTSSSIVRLKCLKLRHTRRYWLTHLVTCLDTKKHLRLSFIEESAESAGQPIMLLRYIF